MGPPTIIATTLILGMTMALAPPLWLKMQEAQRAALDAQEAALQGSRDMAFCERHPTYDGPPCRELSGARFSCARSATGDWICRGDGDPPGSGSCAPAQACTNVSATAPTLRRTIP